MGPRRCCCGAPSISCCGEWPTFCAESVGLGYSFFSIHRTLIHHGAVVSFKGGPENLEATYHSSTTATDPATNLAVCSFPEPTGEFPYPVVMPGNPPIEVRPFNYSVPIFRGESSEGEFDLVWPILQPCCIGAGRDQLVVGYELRNPALVAAFDAHYGPSPNNLTGLYNGVGEHWYITSLGHFRYFGDPGVWSRDGLPAGLDSFQPFRLGHPGAVLENNGLSYLQVEHYDWCKENGEGSCRCNFSFPEDPACCDYYTASLFVEMEFDSCVTAEFTSSCIMASPPSPCPTGQTDSIGIKNSLYKVGQTIANGSWQLSNYRCSNGSCWDWKAPDPSQFQGFFPPVILGAAVGCNLKQSDLLCIDCENPPPEEFDALFCLEGGYFMEVDAPYGNPCHALVYGTTRLLIGVQMRKYGHGCCIDSYPVSSAYWLDISGPGSPCVWRPVKNITLSFECL